MASASPAAFAAIALLCVATPGPNTLLAFSQGARHGWRGALPGLAGAGASDLLLITAVAGGLSTVLASAPAVFELVRWLGVACLAALGLRLLHQAGGATATTAADTPGPPPEPGALARRGLLVALTNPKGYLFFAALLPPFVDSARPLLPQYAALAAIFVTLDLAVLATCAAAGARLGRLPARAATRRWIDRGCGALLVVLAVGIARQPAPPARPAQPSSGAGTLVTGSAAIAATASATSPRPSTITSQP